jgi:outer membrane protein assembly factor BamB
MTPRENDRPLSARWPRGLAFVAITVGLQWFLWAIVPVVAPSLGLAAMIGAVVCAVVVLLWWLFFSGVSWGERLAVLVVMVAAVVVTRRVVHPSMSNGMMGMLIPVYAVPTLCLALVGAMVVSRGRSRVYRRASTLIAIALGCAVFAVLRTEGVSGEGGSTFRWRWTPDAEARLLATAPPLPAATSASPPPAVTAPSPAEPSPPAPSVPPAPATRSRDWPGFRGPARDGVAAGTRIDTNWSSAPPSVIWRRPIGPGWSSFAVSGDLLYTQEQRGDDEVVACYRVATGAPVWAHRDGVRFYESNAGAGPRGTPAVHGGRVYAFGATGIVNALDARTGVRVWSRNAAADTERKIPGWGFSSSPLVVGDLVVVAASGQLVAYDAASGTPRWFGPTGGGSSYSSPHLVTIAGVPQVVLLAGGSVVSVAPADGRVLWQHAWQADGGNIVQPAILPDGDLLITANDMMGGVGVRRLSVTRDSGGWKVTERWSTRGLKPYYNDFVVHDGHAYGFDGTILAAIDLTDGTRKWKGGRYGTGQMVLLPDQDLLLVLAEDGGLALVRAAPDQFTEVARAPAISGKTWNHPAIAGDVLLVRNGEEMAAVRLPAGGR